MKNFHPALVLPFALVSMTALRGCVVFISYFPSGTKISVWWDKYTCTYAQLHEMHTFYTKSHTHRRTNSLDQSVPSSIPQFMDCLREETGAESSCPRLRCFMTLTWGQKHKEWVGWVWRIRMVLWAFCLRSSQNREATGWKSKSAVLEADLTICSRWVFFPLSRYTVVPDKVEETKDAFNDKWSKPVHELLISCRFS